MLAKKLAAWPTLAYGRMKKLMHQSFDQDFPTQLDAERDAIRACAETEDFKAALAAFFAKRLVAFKGR